jgi:hypothetical protein
MKKTDIVFIATYKWIKSLEETISPHFSPESLKLIIILADRCKVMLMEPIAPMILSQVKSRFDDFEVR